MENCVRIVCWITSTSDALENSHSDNSVNGSSKHVSLEIAFQRMDCQFYPCMIRDMIYFFLFDNFFANNFCILIKLLLLFKITIITKIDNSYLRIISNFIIY